MRCSERARLSRPLFLPPPFPHRAAVAPAAPVAELGVVSRRYALPETDAEVRFASRAALWHVADMSNREIVIDLLSRLPEDMPLEEVAREIEFLAGIQTARQQASRREGIPAEDARKLIDAWAGQ